MNLAKDDLEALLMRDYPLPRCNSEIFSLEGSGSPGSGRSIRIQALENAITELRWRVQNIENDTGMDRRWGVRYSQRLAIIANIFLGIWNFWSEFVNLLQKRRRVIVSSFLKKSTQTSSHLNEVISDAYQVAVWRSSFSFLCALLISSKYNWKRIIGLVLSISSTFYLAPIHPVGNFLAMFANLAYALMWALMPPANVRSQNDKKKSRSPLTLGSIEESKLA